MAEMILTAKPARRATEVPTTPALAVSVALERDVTEAVLYGLDQAWRERG